ncbi:MAG TPA: PaaI family thioesterase [Phenylobacterium sp.]
MDGGGNENGYAAALTTATDGEWAGWSHYPGGDPFEDLAGPFYFRVDDQGPVCAFRIEKRHLNASGFLHGGCFMTFADFALFVIASDALTGQNAVTATFNCELAGAASEGQLVECRGDVVKAARSMIFVRGLMTAGGDTIMSFSATVKKRSARTG